MKRSYLPLIGSLLATLAVPWAFGAKTPLDQTKTRIALPMDTAPIIDGVINSGAGEEWSQVVSTSWSLTVGEEDILGGALGGGELPTDDTDLSATIFAGIADEHLYIAVQVLDDDISTDTVEAGSENGNTWQDDGIEIFIDGDNSMTVEAA